MEPRAPSGLFPSPPPRPTFREPHPVRLAAVLTGAGASAAWLLMAALFATSAATYIWYTLAASVIAAGVAGGLVRHGDRGVATGVAITTALGASLAVVLLVLRWS